MDTVTHECVPCGQAPIWDTYAEYADDFWAYEYEGDRGHAPDDEALFDYYAFSCLSF